MTGTGQAGMTDSVGGVEYAARAAGDGSATSGIATASSESDGATDRMEAGVTIGIIGRSGNAAPSALPVPPTAGDGSGAAGAAGRGCGVADANEDAFATPKTPGVETDGVGRRDSDMPPSISPTSPGVPGRTRGLLTGELAGDAGERSGVGSRVETDGVVSGVVAPSVIRRMAPQTLQRARMPFGGTLAGSTRNTDRQS